MACPIRSPERAFGNRYGALVMLSIPPATMTSALPAMIASCASIVAFIAEPHIFDKVVQFVFGGHEDGCLRATPARFELAASTFGG